MLSSVPVKWWHILSAKQLEWAEDGDALLIYVVITTLIGILVTPNRLLIHHDSQYHNTEKTAECYNHYFWGENTETTVEFVRCSARKAWSQKQDSGLDSERVSVSTDNVTIIIMRTTIYPTIPSDPQRKIIILTQG